MAKKVVAIVKLQCPAGAANPSPPVGPGARPARRQHHGVLQGVQRAHAGPGGPDHPRGDHRLRRSHLHLRAEDAAGGGAAEAAAKIEKGSGEPNRTKVGTVTKRQVREIARAEAARSERPRRRARRCASSRARPARWASTWWRAERCRARQALSSRSRERGRPRRRPTRSREAVDAAEGDAARRSSTRASTSPSTSASIRSHADQMVRGAIVLPHGTGKSMRVAGVRQGRQGEGGARGRAPTTSAPTTSPRRSRTRAGSSSTA